MEKKTKNSKEKELLEILRKYQDCPSMIHSCYNYRCTNEADYCPLQLKLLDVKHMVCLYNIVGREHLREVSYMNPEHMKEYNTIQGKEIYNLQDEHENHGEHYSVNDAANEWVDRFAAKFHDDFAKHESELENICDYFCGGVDKCKGIENCPLTNKLLENILDGKYHIKDEGNKE